MRPAVLSELRCDLCELAPETPNPVAKNCARTADQTEKRLFTRYEHSTKLSRTEKSYRKIGPPGLLRHHNKKNEKFMRHYTRRQDKTPESADGPAVGNFAS